MYVEKRENVCSRDDMQRRKPESGLPSLLVTGIDVTMRLEDFLVRFFFWSDLKSEIRGGNLCFSCFGFRYCLKNN